MDYFHQLFSQVWYNEMSADEAYDSMPYVGGAEVEEKIHDLFREVWYREMSADEAYEIFMELSE